MTFRLHDARLALLVLLLLAPAASATHVSPASGLDDLLFTNVDASWRVGFDDAGHAWFTTEGGLVRMDTRTRTRDVFTAVDGMPSSYSMGLAIQDGQVYVGTDGGLAIVDASTREIRAVTPRNSPLRVATVQDVAVEGDVVWLGTRHGGVAQWNRTSDAWTFHNTSTRPDALTPAPIRRIVLGPSAAWAATEGDGLWRYDRAARSWSNLSAADGLATNDVLSLVEQGDHVWIGTAQGLQRWTPATGEWRRYGTAQGMPHERVLDLDLIPSAEDTLDLWASTPRGLWQLDLETNSSTTHDAAFGLLGSYVLDNLWNATHGWLVGTERGVSHFVEGAWHYYTTSPHRGPANGPFTARLTAAHHAEGSPYTWFGSTQGIIAYERPTVTTPGRWWNLGPSNGYQGSLVNDLHVHGAITWMATINGTYGYDRVNNTWISRAIEGTRGLSYGLDVDRNELWVAYLGEGLYAEDLSTGVRRGWSPRTPLAIPDGDLLDVDVQGKDAWVAAARGLIRMDRDTGSVTGFWTQREGVPGGTVYRVLAEGDRVWLATKSEGVALLDARSGQITQVWNRSRDPAFPVGEINALHREGDRLWVGTMAGMWRLDVRSGETRTWNVTNSRLVQNFVTGFAEADGLLHFSTYSGVGRLDLRTEELLPMRDGPGVVRGTPPQAPAPDPVKPSLVSVRVESPRDGAAVPATEVLLRGSAFRFGGRVDHVEVKVGDGAWVRAVGAETWQRAWDFSNATPNEQVVVRARAVSGGETSREHSIVVTPVAVPTIPLGLEDLTPDETTAGRPFVVTARIQGDPPLSATLHYKTNVHAPTWSVIDLARQGSVWTATIPGAEVREGEIVYWLEARSGPFAATAPEDPATPTRVRVAPPPRLALAITGPASWTADAGSTTRIPIEVANAGTEPASFRLRAMGLRASWLVLPDEAYTVPPGQKVAIEATLVVPARAFSDTTNLTFEARDVDGLAAPALASVPLQVRGDDGGDDGKKEDEGGKRGRIPGPSPLAILAAAGVALLVLRRRAP